MTNQVLSSFTIYFIANPEVTQVIDGIENGKILWRNLISDIKGYYFLTKDEAIEKADSLKDLESYKIVKGTIQVEVCLD